MCLRISGTATLRSFVGSPKSLIVILSLGAWVAFAHSEKAAAAPTPTFEGTESAQAAAAPPRPGRGVPQLPEKRSVEIALTYTAEFGANVIGGVERGAVHLGNIDLTLTIDANRWLNWHGCSLFFYGLANYSTQNPSELVGDIQGISNIAADPNVRLYEAWLQQTFFDDMISARFGLYDLNSEFDTIEAAALFAHSAHGIGTDYAQSGKRGPSIFPLAALAARLHIAVPEGAYAQVAVFDGEPEELWKLELSAADGLLISGEAGFVTADRAIGLIKAAAGFWLYTADFPDIQDPYTQRTGNAGAYTLMEFAAFREETGNNQGLTLFARAGLAHRDINPVHYYLGLGAVYHGLLPSRNEDAVGFALASAFFSPKARRAMAETGPRAAIAETVLEASYRALLRPWLYAFLDFQYVVNPSAETRIDNALYVATRLELVL